MSHAGFRASISWQQMANLIQPLIIDTIGPRCDSDVDRGTQRSIDKVEHYHVREPHRRFTSQMLREASASCVMEIVTGWKIRVLPMGRKTTLEAPLLPGSLPQAIQADGVRGCSGTSSALRSPSLTAE